MGLPRLAGWPTALVVLIGATLAVGLPVGGYYTYRAYDYIEHDNDFCMSCHLMAEPFEAFARSEHRGLGCKACHQPTLAGRSQMALTQVLEQPEELETHAEVPDELCAGCHVEGDPDQWRLIAQSAGHRIHLESSDSSLVDIACVGCHSSTLHQFSAVDETCGQSDCHTDTEVALGRMGDLTIHCVACHAFRAPLGAEVTPEEVSAALRPDADECLSCHVMRAMVEMPEDEAHESVCATCHNPHTQATAEEASQTCSNAGCHDAVTEESDFHVGLTTLDVGDCLSCHTAHDFSTDGSDCAACHQAALEDPHDVHPDVQCTSCHAEDLSHGRVTVLTADQCQACHHDAAPPETCESCHDGGLGIPTEPATVLRAVRSIRGDSPPRPLPFDHAVHAEEACATCHTGTMPNLDATPLDCTSCHQEHHTPDSDCMSCHVQAPASDHPTDQVHVGCTGAGCHSDAPFQEPGGLAVPRTRELCLTCHQDLADHRVEQNCVDCHPLPRSAG